MANYRIEVVRSAEKTLFRLPKKDIVRVTAAIAAMAINPYPDGCRKLAGQNDTFRIRIGVYRVIYEVYEDIILVKVLKVGHRKDVYRFI